MQPLIGITMNEKPGFGADLRASYYQALTEAGALALALPPLPPSLAGPLLARVDGLLLAGGGDVEPRHYGEKPLAGLGETEPERDLWELALGPLAWGQGMPILAICRGMQLLNIALGGSLWQDSRYLPQPVLPHLQKESAWQPTHQVSLLCPYFRRLLGQGELKVNSHHHQMLRDLAPSLQIGALAPDGVIEAIVPLNPGSQGFCLGLQWHPERLADKASREIFAHFVAASRDYMRRG